MLTTTAGEKFMVRDTAIATLLETAKVNGSALGRLSTAQFADVLNTCLSVARGNSLLLYRGEKICAVLSEGYVPMQISRLLRETLKILKSKFGTVRFVEGVNSYNISSALFELPDAQENLIETYSQAVAAH